MKKTSHINFLRTRIVVVAAIILVGMSVVVGMRLASPDSTSQSPVTPTPIVQLPRNWSFITDKESVSEVKVERKTKSGIKPTILFSSVKLKVKDPAAYISKLQKGAFFAIPSLVITEEKTETTNGAYTVNMAAHYQNGDDTVYVAQRIIITGETVYTITGSFGEDTAALRQEIRDVFGLLQNVYGN